MVVERVTSARGLEELAAAGPDAALTLRRLDVRSEPYWKRASYAAFVARQGRRVIGRVVAVAEQGAGEVGFFACLECPDDVDAARALLEAAGQWLRSEGRSVLRGPLRLGMGDELGALVEGFEPAPPEVLPRNARYLGPLLERVGLRLAHERHGYAWSRDEVPAPPASLRAAQTGEVVYRTVDPARAGDEARRFVAAYNAGMAERWGFRPLGESEAEARLREVIAFGDARLVWLAEVRGEPAGAVLAMPAAGAGEAEGAPGLAALRALRRSLSGRRLERVCLLTVAVDPRFRPLHVGAQLILRVWRAALDLGVREAELAGIDADDHAMQQLLWRLGCRRIRRYAVFEQSLR